MAIVVWDEIFTNKDYQFDNSLSKDEQKQLACAYGLMGWALCMSGHTPPDNFGHGMVKIAKILDINPDPDNLMDYSKRWKNDQD